jgi:enoyl-CoA hydratase
MNTHKQVHYHVTKQIAEIILNRPPVNSFSIDFLNEILNAFRRASNDKKVRAVILRSTLPKVFCAGLDLDILIDKPALEVRKFLEKLYSDLWDVQYNMGKPTIAAVNGAARGGGMTLAISAILFYHLKKRHSDIQKLIWDCYQPFISCIYRE